MAIDEIRNQEGLLRKLAGGSSTGMSTGGALIGTEDPLAGINAVTPGLDSDGSGGLSRTRPQMPEISTFGGASRSGGGGGLLRVVALLGAALVALGVVARE